MTQVAPTDVSSGASPPLGGPVPEASTRRFRFPTQPLIRHGLFALCGAGILYLLTIQLSPYNDFLVGEIALYVIALAGLSLLTGVNGQI